ncbi:MAG: TonB-dependent receptor [Rhodospirillaceae bacterium]
MTFRHFVSTLLTTTAAGAILSAIAAPSSVMAQSATPLPPVAVDTSPDLTRPLASAATTRDGIAVGRLSTADTTRLLEDLGIDSLTGGGISNLPSIHGLADDRLNVEIDGQHITSACPNHMNPATSYISPTKIGKAEVWAGITPVSQGGDSIGGTISIASPDPVFAGPGEKLHKEGSLSTTYRSINNNIEASGSATAALQNYSLGYTGSYSRAENYRDGNNKKVTSTGYEVQNHSLTAAIRTDNSLFVVEGGAQLIPYEGFVNQQMDMVGNQSLFLNTRYEGEFDWGKLEANLYGRNVKHNMNTGKDKFALAMMWMPMNTEGNDVGYSVKADIPLDLIHTLRIGNEFQHFDLNDKWPAVPGDVGGWMGPSTFVSMNHGQRDRFGSYVEWEAKWTPQWSTLLGGRVEAVWMDTGNVQGYSTVAGPGYQTDANAFNARSHARTDVNFDMTALTRYEPNKISTFEAGYARKTRSPNLYERYAWSKNTMAGGMINWFGDGNAYVGNLDLKPEVANTVSITANLHDGGRTDWDIKVTPYYTYVQDYINVNPVTPTAGGGTLLQFANQDAEIYGIDFSGKKTVWEDGKYGKGVFKGTIGWLHGQTTSGNALYNMMPLNGKIAFEHSLGGWTSAIEAKLVDGKSEADASRQEPFTPGYVLFNLRTGYQWESVRFDVGIDNLLNKKYYQPLGGKNYDDYAASGWKSLQPLAGPGRSYMAGMTVKF